MNNTEHERLEYVVSAFFAKRSDAASAIGVSLSQLGNYTSGRNKLGMKMASALKSAGISDTWIKHGEGSMFADNDAGRELKKKFGTEEEISDNRIETAAAVNSDEVHRLRDKVAKLEGELEGLRWSMKMLAAVLANHGILIEAAGVANANQPRTTLKLIMDEQEAEHREVR